LIAVALAAMTLCQPALSQGSATPILASASVPTYPPIWQFAQIQGKVVVRIMIRNGIVVNTEIKSGDNRLQDSTIANLKTWRFGNGVNTAITIAYTYQISGEPTDGLTNPTVKILPNLDVRITARPVKPAY
jgi:outer membrane biosynthesis protein TonB